MRRVCPRKRLTPHYPSWGFETHFTAGFYVRDLELITPHGDLKPQHGDSNVQAIVLLITPHGDLKLAIARAIRAAGTPSLPLMGI